jgi:hypothetical protein
LNILSLLPIDGRANRIVHASSRLYSVFAPAVPRSLASGLVSGGRRLHPMFTLVANPSSENPDPGPGTRLHIVCSSFSDHARGQLLCG